MVFTPRPVELLVGVTEVTTGGVVSAVPATTNVSVPLVLVLNTLPEKSVTFEFSFRVTMIVADDGRLAKGVKVTMPPTPLLPELSTV